MCCLYVDSQSCQLICISADAVIANCIASNVAGILQSFAVNQFAVLVSHIANTFTTKFWFENDLSRASSSMNEKKRRKTEKERKRQDLDGNEEVKGELLKILFWVNDKHW